MVVTIVHHQITIFNFLPNFLAIWHDVMLVCAKLMQKVPVVMLYTILVSTFTSLAPVAKVQGTITHAFPGWQRPTAYNIRENAFDDLAVQLTAYLLQLNCQSYEKPIREGLNSMWILTAGRRYLLLEMHQYCINSFLEKTVQSCHPSQREVV